MSINVQPYYIVPLLVEQPTWGGSYIAEFKHLSQPEVLSTKIGQAFELFDGSLITTQAPTDQGLAYALAPATNLQAITMYQQTAPTLTLQSLIDQNPEHVLGQQVVAKTGPVMKTLIKFTQAKNNSYQVHVQPGHEFSHWLPKPESWYYFEPGLVTLGLRAGTNVSEYQQRCMEIDAYAQQLSQQVASQALTVEAARQQLQVFIDQDHPSRFVNTVPIAKNQIVDLSECGIHHSWETNADLPAGNRVYEVQVDVKDEHCTLRSFDQGNLKDDGSVRPLAIDDYFQALNTDPDFNRIERYFKTAQPVQEHGATITTLFDNQYYHTTLVEFTGNYQGQATQTQDSFHHVFAKTGPVSVITNHGEFNLPSGWSLFIPAATEQYQLHSDQDCQVLITSA